MSLQLTAAQSKSYVVTIRKTSLKDYTSDLQQVNIESQKKLLRILKPVNEQIVIKRVENANKTSKNLFFTMKKLYVLVTFQICWISSDT